jgi:hypothetical protein
LSTITVLQASAEFEARVEQIKKAFGLPAWITRGYKPAQSANQVRTPIFTRVSSTFPTTSIFPPSAFTIGSVPSGIPIVCKSISVAELNREDNLIAHLDLAELARPTKATIQSRILTWFETPTDKVVSLKEIKAAFPDVAPSSLSSRVAELVKTEQIVKDTTGETVHAIYFLTRV